MDSERATAAWEGPGYEVVPVDDPVCRRNGVFMAFENYHGPRVKKFRARHDLDAVAEGVEGEWSRILALRHWIRSAIEIEDDDPTPAREEAFAISRMRSCEGTARAGSNPLL